MNLNGENLHVLRRINSNASDKLTFAGQVPHPAHDPVGGTPRSRGAFRLAVLLLTLVIALIDCGVAQPEGKAALDTFLQWKRSPGNAQLEFGDALTKYHRKLRADGASNEVANRTIRLIVAYDEAELYNGLYAAPPKFNTKPNQLLVEAVEGVRPGKALDVAMGQGRNSLYLASRGWDVTGFDVAEVGLQKAREQATLLGLKIKSVHASDEEFDFGRDRWDLIAIIYALEKRSVQRVRDALKPGGTIVVEAGRSDTSRHTFEFQSKELLQVFDGFRILKYEEAMGPYDWGPERIRLVRLIAQKPK